MGTVIAIVGIAVLFAAAFAVRVFSQRRGFGAVQEMHSWASSQGYVFADADDSRIGHWSNRPFGVGTHRHAKRVVSGSFSGRTFVAFDYTYETGGGLTPGTVATTNHAVWHYAVCIVQLPAALADIVVTAKSARDKARNWVEPRDRSRRPAVRARLRGAMQRPTAGSWQLAADVLPAATRSRLVQHRLTGVHITGNQLIAWQRNASNKPAVLADRLTVLADLIAAVPASTWHSR